jgi:hypothetical protein
MSKRLMGGTAERRSTLSNGLVLKLNPLEQADEFDIIRMWHCNVPVDSTWYLLWSVRFEEGTFEPSVCTGGGYWLCCGERWPVLGLKGQPRWQVWATIVLMRKAT